MLVTHSTLNRGQQASTTCAHARENVSEARSINGASPDELTSADILGMRSRSTASPMSIPNLSPPTIEMRKQTEKGRAGKRTNMRSVTVSWPHHLSSEDDSMFHANNVDHHQSQHHEDRQRSHHKSDKHVLHLDVYNAISRSFEAKYSGAQKSHAILDLPDNSYLRTRIRYENKAGVISQGPEAIAFGRPHPVRTYGCGRWVFRSCETTAC